MAEDCADPFVAVTPLYAFSSHSDELVIGKLFDWSSISETRCRP